MCRVIENERNIAYIKIWLIDDNGTINSQEAEKDCFMIVLLCLFTGIVLLKRY